MKRGGQQASKWDVKVTRLLTRDRGGENTRKSRGGETKSPGGFSFKETSHKERAEGEQEKSSRIKEKSRERTSLNGEKLVTGGAKRREYLRGYGYAASEREKRRDSKL